jgi:hypothetical protein
MLTCDEWHGHVVHLFFELFSVIIRGVQWTAKVYAGAGYRYSSRNGGWVGDVGAFRIRSTPSPPHEILSRSP